MSVGLFLVVVVLFLVVVVLFLVVVVCGGLGVGGSRIEGGGGVLNIYILYIYIIYPPHSQTSSPLEGVIYTVVLI